LHSFLFAIASLLINKIFSDDGGGTYTYVPLWLCPWSQGPQCYVPAWTNRKNEQRPTPDPGISLHTKELKERKQRFDNVKEDVQEKVSNIQEASTLWKDRQKWTIFTKPHQQQPNGDTNGE